MARRRCLFVAMAMAMAMAMAGESTTSSREQEEENNREVQRNRERHLLARIGGPKYQLGSEEHDGVCTSLDGPRCNPDEKARHLAQERAKISGAHLRQDGSRKTSSTRVKTVQEFKFEGGKEVHKSMEKTLHSENSEPVVIFKTITSGDDLNKVISQVQAEINEALKGICEDANSSFNLLPQNWMENKLEAIRRYP
eukprot:752363-Hanusia_phi.AAC.3